MTTKTYRVRGIDIDHDGTRYAEGERIELDDKVAAKLRKFLEEVPVQKSPAGKAEKAPGIDDKKEAKE